MISQAVISAGGFGTRLRPYTEAVPKPMLLVGGKPLLEWHVEQFKQHGVQDFFFTLHHLPGIIQDYFGDGSRFGVRIRYVVETEPHGSAGALRALAGKLDPVFYFTYGDIFSEMDYTEFSEAYAALGAPLGMQRTMRTDAHADADVAELDAEGRFIAIHRKPHQAPIPHAHRMRGVFILNASILDYIPPGVAGMADVLERVIAAGEPFYGYECEEYTKGIDTIEKLQEVEAHVAATRI